MQVGLWDGQCGWSLAVDHTNYAQWLPVGWGDMVMFADADPHANEAFMKSTKIFGLVTKDQSHEQHNKSLQAHGDALGLYESPDALILYYIILPLPWVILCANS
jgi:hypothetical protein